MQVKKFEAKSMKDALAMVKAELGPDAIILQAKDYKKGFGIGGGASVELTAAISEQKYKERQFALARLKAEEQEKLRAANAKTQKKFIQKAVNRYFEGQNERQKSVPQRPQYISIDNEDTKQSQEENLSYSKNGYRVKDATKLAVDAFKKDFFDNHGSNKISKSTKPQTQNVKELENEIKRLQGLIRSFNKVPQNIIESYPGSEFKIKKHMSFMFERLVESGISKDLVAEIIKQAQESMPVEQQQKKALIEAWIAKYILETTSVTDDKSLRQLEVFIGAAGSGKTASLIKYASYQIIVHRKSVAILTTDTNKVGAIEQLKIYAKILNVPFAVIHKEEDWDPILQQLSNVDSILIDTPGSSLKDIHEIDDVKKKIKPIADKSRIHYVMSATSNEQPALELARRFKMFHYHDVIVTKLDESVNHGLIYSINQKMESPLHSFGIGTKVPEDYEFASRERVLDLIFKITKAKG